MLCGMAVLGLLALLMLQSRNVALGIVGIAGGILMIWVAWRVQRDEAQLLCALLVIEELSGATFLPLTDNQHYMVRYPLLIAFCVTAVWTGSRRMEIWRGGFRDYLIYFGLGVISIGYSLVPEYSAARIGAAFLIFMGIVTIAWSVTDRKSVDRLLKWYLIGTGIVWIVVLLGMVLMSQDLVWDVEKVSGVVRLRSIYGSPNAIGEMALATIGTGMVVWGSMDGWKRVLLGAEMAIALALGVLADSRSPFVGVAVGGLLYLIWRYRMRAVPMIVVLGVVSVGLVSQLNPKYLTRGNVSSLTGRTEIWRFAIEKIEQRPLFGWGFEVEGEIMKARDFPIWWGPWEEGPRSSLHNEYLSKAVSLGVPALLFWVFFFMRPWLALLRSKEDPWNLKPLFFLVVVPVLLLDFTEGTAGECRFAVGIIATLGWALAERWRLATRQRRAATVSPQPLILTTPSLRRTG
ncbi:MAG TPA: O-antigen ligase family protein [Candidatus Acidoferrales bacterium]|nr:O-antigen ligase family protein [Candidatus Acidoferrales bacterium]